MNVITPPHHHTRTLSTRRYGLIAGGYITEQPRTRKAFIYSYNHCDKGLTNIISYRIHGAGILMLTWLGYMDGIHVTIYSSTMDSMGIFNKDGNDGTTLCRKPCGFGNQVVLMQTCWSKSVPHVLSNSIQSIFHNASWPQQGQLMQIQQQDYNGKIGSKMMQTYVGIL